MDQESKTIEQQKYRIKDRWTEIIARRGFTPVANLFLDKYSDMGISSSEALLIVHLMRYKWDQSHPFPSSDLLARNMGITQTAVRNHARSLERKGFLIRIARGGKSNEYDLRPLFERLEDFYSMKALKPGTKNE